MLGCRIGGPQDQVPRSNVYNYCFCLLVGSVAFNQGYYSTVYSPLGNPWLENEHNITEQGKQSSIMGTVSGLYCLGCAIGVVLGAWMVNRFGRVWTVVWTEAIRIPIVCFYMINVIGVLYGVR